MVTFCLNLFFPIKEVKELGGDTRWSGREKQTGGAGPSRDARHELGGQSYHSPAPMTHPQPHQPSNGPHVSRPPPAYPSPERTFQSIEDAYFNQELKSARPAPYIDDLPETISPTPRLHNEPEIDTDVGGKDTNRRYGYIQSIQVPLLPLVATDLYGAATLAISHKLKTIKEITLPNHGPSRPPFEYSVQRWLVE
ncbi:hypothetical protein H112_03365 [Trichophyton rubrum D6]|nr:hypothetical protein H100_03368 [Trichophyton rubrum MR850]EZF43070.1 hypothetical protein H102_03364 [Trichophyton rubrum CBS 100081]EZF53711.1 hypothetical protein H103_03375 [Trichophyton rubrum CBS 288.86]EZF64333.1 hypothetical protein H104_03358 [Trichophyton rubrum CBS 289.86]EZF74952.1 hypothetical protein H105_03382 [Trichophyton soudanense CBS 452.61]EZF85627.1 hypothetical protein H110_03370 [Trichophyton rubrum MR1448]EZF96413.1 hypothetical protein H113_03380 [Trichophyton rub